MMRSLTIQKIRPTHGTEEISRAKLAAEVRRSLDDHWGSHRKVVEVQIRTVEGNVVHGFLTLTNGVTRDSFLLDFEATLSQRGSLLSLQVAGRSYPISRARRRTGARA